MRITKLLTIAAAAALALTACSSGAPESTAAAADTAPAQISGGTAEYDGAKLEVTGAEFVEDYTDTDGAEGIPAVMVHLRFTNEGADPLYALESFGIAAYQDGAELEMVSLNDDLHEEAGNIIAGVKDGAGIDCMAVFATVSDSPVEIRITEPTADAALLVSEIFDK